MTVSPADAAAVILRRADAALALADDAEAVSSACYAMAQRFHGRREATRPGQSGRGLRVPAGRRRA